jgi:pSer/pThr/pTyr-binding forkhead associated (FHA) protein
MPKLTVSLPDGTEIPHDLVEEKVTIGRLPDNTIQIEDASVSSNHAVLTLEGNDYILQDIGSTNGTRHNGQDLPPETDRRIQDGDRIRFGKIETTYASDSPNEGRPMPTQEESTLRPAAESVLPADFANASPFQTKKKKKDPVGTAILVFGIVAILAFGAAMLSVFGLQAPVN